MEFTIALVLIQLYPNSLLLVSVYGMLDNAARISMGGAIGAYIDRAERWEGARNCYLIQNACISGSGVCMAVVLSGLLGTPGSIGADQQTAYWALVAAALLMSAMSSVGSTGITIAVEKVAEMLCERCKPYEHQ